MSQNHAKKILGTKSLKQSVKKPTIGILGAGAFGTFFAKQLQQYTTVVVYDKYCSTTPGLSCVDLDTVLKQDWIILAVPLNEIPRVLKKISSKIQPHQTILDVCSLKVPVCRAFASYIPKTVRTIGTHPLFGPNFANSCKGHSIVLCRCSTHSIADVRQFFTRMGLTCILSTPQQHDSAMGETQTISHMLGSVLLEYDTTRKYPSQYTASYNTLIEYAKKVCAESPYLHSLIQKNPYATKAKKTFLRLCTRAFNKK
jgi:prephenate dehydrogenase